MKMVYSKDENAGMLVQLSLTWFCLAKVIQLAKPLIRATFESIVSTPRKITQIDVRCLI